MVREVPVRIAPELKPEDVEVMDVINKLAGKDYNPRDYVSVEAPAQNMSVAPFQDPSGKPMFFVQVQLMLPGDLLDFPIKSGLVGTNGEALFTEKLRAMVPAAQVRLMIREDALKVPKEIKEQAEASISSRLRLNLDEA